MTRSALNRAGEITHGWHELSDGTTLLGEPLTLDGRAIGTLVAGWRDRARRLPDRTMTLVSMIAAEGAVAIDRESLLNKLEELARHDELTGLLNRRALAEELAREVATASRHDRSLSVVMLDLDHFKVYNDTHGHQAGDQLLKSAAAAWLTQVRRTDRIARYGGEEFVVILPDCDLDNAKLAGNRLRAAMPTGATCSAWVADLQRGDSAEALVGRADRALYCAKAPGRDRTECSDPEELDATADVMAPSAPVPG
jgi:diguanylate cyclase (GGDEF)-like protein